MSTPHSPRTPPQYHPRLLELLAAPTPFAELTYLIGAGVVDLLPLAVPSSLPSPASDSTSAPPSLLLPPIEQYISEVARRVRRPTGVLLAVLVYINRLKKIIPASARGKLNCTHHRIFFGAFSLACKYLWDSKYDLARASLLFDPPSVARIERELLSLFDYRVEISAEELTAQALIVLYVYPDIRFHRSNCHDRPELPLPPSKRRKTDARLSPDTSSPLASLITIRQGACSAQSDSGDESPLNLPNSVRAPSASPSPNDPFSLDPSPTPYNTAISGFSDLDIFHTPRSSSSSPVPFLTPPPSNAPPSSSESPLRSPPSSPPPLGTPSPFSDELNVDEEDEQELERWAVGRGTIFAPVGDQHRSLKRRREDDN